MARSRVTLTLVACLLAIFLTNNLPYVSGAITGGSSGGEGIRISKDKKGKSSVRLKKKGARQKAPGRVETPTFQPTAKETELMELTPDAPQEAPPPPPPECDSDLSLLQISEPPDGSTVQGSGFDVGVQIMPCNTDLFNASYANPTSRICLSLDDSPFYCWPIFGGKLRFINAVEGQHTLKAVLMKRGEMVDETASEEVRPHSHTEGDVNALRTNAPKHTRLHAHTYLWPRTWRRCELRCEQTLEREPQTRIRESAAKRKAGKRGREASCM